MQEREQSIIANVKIHTFSNCVVEWMQRHLVASFLEVLRRLIDILRPQPIKKHFTYASDLPHQIELIRLTRAFLCLFHLIDDF